MIVMLQADGSVVLHQAQEFRHLHLEVDPVLDGIAPAQARLGTFAAIESRDTAWIDRDALFALGREAAPEPDRWADCAEEMLAKAARFGWVRAASPSIKSHIVWRNAPAVHPKENA